MNIQALWRVTVCVLIVTLLTVANAWSQESASGSKLAGNEHPAHEVAPPASHEAAPEPLRLTTELGADGHTVIIRAAGPAVGVRSYELDLRVAPMFGATGQVLLSDGLGALWTSMMARESFDGVRDLFAGDVLAEMTLHVDGLARGEFEVFLGSETAFLFGDGTTARAEVAPLRLTVERATADVNANGVVDPRDLVEILTGLGSDRLEADVDRNGVVDVEDVSEAIEQFGRPAVGLSAIESGGDGFVQGRAADPVAPASSDPLGREEPDAPSPGPDDHTDPDAPKPAPNPNPDDDGDRGGGADDLTPPRINRFLPGPWVRDNAGLGSVQLGFDEDVVVAPGSIDLRLTSGGTPSVSSMSYDETEHLFTIEFDPPLEEDRLVVMADYTITDAAGNELDGEVDDPFDADLPSGDGVRGGQAVFVVSVLQGDANRDGVVDQADGQVIANSLNLGEDDPGFDERADVNGDGFVNALDVITHTTALGRTLPTGDGMAPAVESRTPEVDESVRALELANVTVRFDEPVDPALVTERSLYTIDPLGGLVTADSILLADGNREVMFVFDPPLQDFGTQGFNLSGALADPSGELLDTASTKKWPAFLDNKPARIVSTSPSDGEDQVAVTRETILEFDHPIDPASISPAAMFGQFAGMPLPAMINRSQTGRRITIFYEDDLPASSRIRVTVDGGQLIDDLGLAVDADGDGAPGGIEQFDFDTLTLTTIPGTAVCGRVFASQQTMTESGARADVPLAGVTITVDGLEDELFAVTDKMGNFRLEPAPAGEFFVHVDGRTATNPDIPEGAFYPFVGKVFKSIPGQETNPLGEPLPGEPGAGDVFLPLVVDETLQPVSEVEDTEIRMPQAAIEQFTDDPAMQQALASIEITVPANSLFADDGTRGGEVGIAPVAPDRLPGQLPPDLGLPLVITVQTDGPTNFDVPVPAVFPNLPDPVTGEVLPPGAKTALWSFDHDLGRWVVNGSMTVSEDGMSVIPDEGTGIRAPGWHGAAPGGGTNPLPPPRKPCIIQPGECPAGLTFATYDALTSFIPVGCLAATIRSTTGLTVDILLNAGIGDFDSDSAAVSATLGYGSAINVCREELLDSRRLGRKIPVIGWGLTAVSFLRSALTSCVCLDDVLPLESRQAETQLDLTIEFFEAYRDYFEVALGSTQWTDAIDPTAFSGDVETAIDQITMIIQSVSATASSDSESGGMITETERLAVLALPRPDEITETDVSTLLDWTGRTFSNWSQGIFTHQMAGSSDFADRDQVLAALQRIDSAAAQLEASGAGGVDIVRTLEVVNEQVISQVTGANPETAVTPIFYRLTNQSSGTSVIGTLTPGLALRETALATDSPYLLELVEGSSLTYGALPFESAPPGGVVAINEVLMIPAPEFLDTDSDGLPDLAEAVIGTQDNNPDSDNDGIPDGTEVLQGTDPLDGLIVQTGIVASSDTSGTAIDVAAFNDIAVVADGGAGVSVFNVFLGLDPTRVAQVDTPGTAQAVAFSGDLVAVADGSAGLAIIDIADPPAASVLHQIPAVDVGGSTRAVATAGNLALVGTVSGAVTVVDMPTGTVLDVITIGAAVQDISVVGEWLYGATVGTLHALRISNGTLEITGTASSPGSVGAGNRRFRVFAGGGFALVTHTRGYNTFDLTDPSQPILVQVGGTGQFGWKQIVANGSGLGVAAVSPNSTNDGPHHINLYDLSDPLDDSQSNEDRFLTTIETPGLAAAVGIFNGLAYVADTSRGLQVINYREFDRNGVPPEASFTVERLSDVDGDVNQDQTLDSRDLATVAAKVGGDDPRADLNRDGLVDAGDLGQMVELLAERDAEEPRSERGQDPDILEEGELLLVSAAVSDDVQVRNVELLIDGEVVQTDGAFPFQFFANAPAFESPDGTDDPIPFDITVRASDTGGNRTLADPETFLVMPDRTPPSVVEASPGEGASLPNRLVESRGLTVRFSESIDESTLNDSGLSLIWAGDDNEFGTSDDQPVERTLSLSQQGRALAVGVDQAPIGLLRLTLADGAVTDLAGNELDGDSDGSAGGVFILEFESIDSPFNKFWVSPTSGDWSNPMNWSDEAVPTLTDLVLIDSKEESITVTVSGGAQAAGEVLTRQPLVLTDGSLTMAGDLTAERDITLAGGRINGGVLNLVDGATLRLTNNSNRLSGVTVNGDLVLDAPLARLDVVDDGVTVNGDLLLEGNSAQLYVSGTGLMLNGRMELSGSSSRAIFLGEQTLPSGEVVFSGLGGSQRAVGIGGGGTLTLGDGVVVRGANGRVGARETSGDAVMLVNRGRIVADADGQAIRVAPGSLVNEGELRAEGGATLDIDADTWTNEGEITAMDSTVILDGSWSNPGEITTDGGVINLGGSFTNEGTLRAEGGATLDIDADTWTNEGEIDIRAGSVLTASALTQLPAGRLIIELAGDALVEHGHVEVSGLAELDGELSVALSDGFVPGVGTGFDVLFYESRTGEFGSFEGLDLGNGTRLDPQYFPSRLRLQTTTVASERADRSR